MKIRNSKTQFYFKVPNKYYNNLMINNLLKFENVYNIYKLKK